MVITSAQVYKETSERPQIQERGLKTPPIEELLPSSRIMEKALPDQALKCPRCDSSNTKFCYYNNYSLSQPRHFCKTCKRYWTRGGTLRNVPVGGGCRKNKRVKRIGGSDHAQPSSQIQVSTTNAQTTDLNSTVHSSLFYNLANTVSGVDINLRFPRFSPPSSVGENLQRSTGNCSDFLNDSLNTVGLGFSTTKQEEDQGSSYVQEQAALNPLLAEWAAATAAASSSATSLVPNISQLGSFSVDRLNPNTNQISSDLSEAQWKQLQQNKHGLALKPNEFPFFVPYEELQTLENGGVLRPETVRTLGSMVKMEEQSNRINQLEWRVPYENVIENGWSDSSSLYWNAAIGVWPNATGYGSSVSPLI